MPSENVETEIVIQKSRFIAQCFRVDDRDAVNGVLEKVRAKYPKAGHHCYACIAGAPTDSQAYGFSDDGEPNGTAGKPMLNVLMHSGVGCILVVVTRYFGGIKLGTGGLVRAYTDATNEVLGKVETVLREEKTEASLTVGYSMEPLIRSYLEKLLIEFSVAYSHEVAFALRLTAGQKEELSTLLVENNLRLQP
ncbi:YigZ family protein [Pelagicoccus albus]|nr:YigZ family protein [Pelagicoccus albus]